MPNPPLNLATLDSKPSWHNLAGRVDRSACIELRASEVKRWADLRPARTGRKPSKRALQRGKPRAYTNREAAGTLTLYAVDIANLHNRRKPRPLSGDYRTNKANAMRCAHDEQGHPLPPSHPKHGGRLHYPGPDHNLHDNPNRGAGRTKLLALPGCNDWPADCGFRMGDFGFGAMPCVGREHDDPHAHHNRNSLAGPSPDPIRNPQSEIRNGNWRQTFTLERWRQHARLAQHFILCPLCGEKYIKLFLPLCTKEELHDALLAQQWLQMQAHIRHRQTSTNLQPLIQKLHHRYGLLFQPRSFQCRKCLGLRYGTGGRHKQT